MLKRFNAHIQNNFPDLYGKRLLLACSGGLDSVVLAHLLVKSGMDVTLAHCNFKLRAEESDGDELFVRELGKMLKIGVEVKAFNTQEQVRQVKGSVQMVARELRYRWFNEMLESHNFDFVLTAHHADDSLETFLINLSRGTGIEGLLGIPELNDKIARPLIPFSKDEILAYARQQQMSWRDDSSNLENKYLRNKIRLEIVPQLKALHPAFLENFKQTQIHLKQSSSIINNHINQLKEGLFEKENGDFRIKIQDLLELQPVDAHIYRLFKDYGFTEWLDVKDLLTGMSGKEVDSKTYRLVKDREYLILTKKEFESVEKYTISAQNTKVKVPIPLKIEAVEIMEEASKNVVFLDKEKLNYPLILRKWEKGDYFYPFGMKGKKKLSKFFKDEKVDVISKSKQWLLCSKDDIVWVIGRRPDERFKVDNTTKDILKITLAI